MEIEDGGFIRSYDIKRNARCYIRALSDKWAMYGSPEKSEYTHDIICHLDDCMINPTKGFLLRHEAFDNFVKQCSQEEYDVYLFNSNRILKNDYIKRQTELLKERLNELYPKTKNLRMALIYNDRIKSNEVLPKMSSLKKLFF